MPMIKKVKDHSEHCLHSRLTLGLAITFTLSFLLLVPHASTVFAGSSTGIMDPLYVFPLNDTSWKSLRDAKINHPQVPIIAIINENSGPPGEMCAQPQYLQEVPKLLEAGIKVIGYVDTNFGDVPITTAMANIDQWHKCYNEDEGINLSGIFFDQMESQDTFDVEYYSELTNHTKSKSGFDFTVGNAGAETKPQYIQTVDNIVIHETGGDLPTLAFLDDWHAEHDKNNFSILPYNKPPPLDTAYVSDASNHLILIYITDDDGSDNNPWNSIASYIDTLAKTLDVPSVGITVESELQTTLNNDIVPLIEDSLNSRFEGKITDMTMNNGYKLFKTDAGKYEFYPDFNVLGKTNMTDDQLLQDLDAATGEIQNILNNSTSSLEASVVHYTIDKSTGTIDTRK